MARRNPGRGAASLAVGVALLVALVLPAQASRESRTTPVVKVVKEASPAVVNIATQSRQKARLFNSGDEFLDRFFEDFLGGPVEREQTSLGSGVIIDGAQGLIATNRHVVSRASEITVQLADRRTFPAQVVGADADSDLAVLRIKAPEALPQARLGDSDDIMIGETVVAIGNPFGLSHTVTTGVVSALNRMVRAERDTFLGGLIQTDASINPGNSGGPLLNLDGELIGINAAIYREAQGIGFAIPVNRMKRVVRDLVSHGEVISNWLGLFVRDLDERLVHHFGLARPEGALVMEVMDRSPAAAAGLRRGDLLLAADGTALEDARHYRSWLAELTPGRQVSLAVLSRGAKTERRLTVAAFPLERAAEVAWLRWGVEVAELDPTTAARQRLRPGSAVMIARLKEGSQAARLGLRPGDLIRQVGDQPTPGLAEFWGQIAKRRLQDSLTILVQRGGIRQFVTLGAG